jgi:hypothetical protein
VFFFSSDNVNGGRTLTQGVGVTGGLTMAKCTTACFNAGYPLAGGEYAGYVYVDFALATYLTTSC